MYKFYQPNTCGKSTGDCTVRALSKALNLGWKDTYIILVAQGLRVCEMPSSNAVWGEVWPVIDELMTTIQVIHPRLYTGVMAKLQ